ncbi:uncharacterized protein LOC129598116 [Paramacrobiotus metropolitanus]|uniref:uncharacterized protein LOC129598116 n=1 Tax=Paramacrobiotus metropolitanus TaxID=2943436 RepID=UPI002446344E|nr:uncharacterized protein LOC129598116 [Paramacrobiotus metropolitanus]
MPPFVINVNNSVIIKDVTEWLWGQVQDVNEAGYLINFDIPQYPAQWIPFDRIFLPPISKPSGRQRNEYSPLALINPRSTLYVAVRSDEKEPFKWQRAKSFFLEFTNTSATHRSYISAEIERNGQKQWEIVPAVRTFQHNNYGWASTDNVFTTRPVTSATFFKVDPAERDEYGATLLENVFSRRSKKFAVSCVTVNRQDDTITLMGTAFGSTGSQQVNRKAFTNIIGLPFWERWTEDLVEDDQDESVRKVCLDGMEIMECMSSGDVGADGVLCVDVVVEIFGYVDSLTQSLLRQVCNRWDDILHHESFRKNIYLQRLSGSGCPGCSFLFQSASDNVRDAGGESVKYLSRKIANRINRSTLLLRLDAVDWLEIQNVLTGNPKFNHNQMETVVLVKCKISVKSYKYDLTDLNDVFAALKDLFRVAKAVVIKECSFACESSGDWSVPAPYIVTSCVVKSYEELIACLANIAANRPKYERRRIVAQERKTAGIIIVTLNHAVVGDLAVLIAVVIKNTTANSLKGRMQRIDLQFQAQVKKFYLSRSDQRRELCSHNIVVTILFKRYIVLFVLLGLTATF